MKTLNVQQNAEMTCAKMYLSLYLDLVGDIAEQFLVLSLELRRDAEEIRRRVSHEGLSFLTKVLPRLGKDFDRSLSSGVPFDPPGFDKLPGSTSPKLFGSLFRMVFDDAGVELASASARTVGAIRQLVYYLYKLEVPWTKDQENEVLTLFKDTDAALPSVLPCKWDDVRYQSIGYRQCVDEDDLQPDDWRVINTASTLIGAIFGSFDHLDIRPKHGPGAVATGEANHEKHVFKRIYSGIERIYPFTEYFVGGINHLAEEVSRLESLETLKTGTAKVVLVPKDSRGPRLISCEPLEYQWIQQGLGTKIQEHLERCSYTSGHVNFTSQEVNRSLALSASIDQQWVTLDMKEASDRVSLALVELLFEKVPDLLEALRATRSTHTRLPNGNVVRLNKFAPMGSNLCFPIESVVFFVLAVSVIVQKYARNRPLGSISNQTRVWRRWIREATERVFVYGDDIILHHEDYVDVMQFFPKVGLMFNQSKCCTKGFFRESCGMDAYKGVSVTPLRLKRVWCHRKLEASTISAYCEHSNLAYQRGYRRLAQHIVSSVESLTGPLPVLPEEPVSYGIPTSKRHIKYGVWCWVRHGSRVRHQPAGVKVRWDTDLQCYAVRCRQASSSHIMVDGDAWSMVLRRITTPSERGIPGFFSLTHRVVPKWVWIPCAGH